MDAEKLHLVLQQSFSPDANLRGPAEETIRNLKHIKGATVMLLQVAAEKQVCLGATFLFNDVIMRKIGIYPIFPPKFL
jgi:hypothetical protein